MQELNEEDIEQVSGGKKKLTLFRCPSCGHESTINANYFLGIRVNDYKCPRCGKKMKQV